MANPLVSVIVPAYNSERYIWRCLRSIQQQTYKNWECIIVLAPSKDKTEEEINTVTLDRRFKLFKEETKTNCATGRNIGYKASKGEYVYFNDSDDWLEPACLETMVNELESNPALSWCVSYQMTHWDNRTYIINLTPGTHHNIGGIGGVLFRKDCLEQIRAKSGHLFNEKLNHTDDGDLILRARHYQHKMIPTVLSNYQWNYEGLTANTHWAEQEWYLIKMLVHRGAWDLLPGNIMNFCIILINETFHTDLVKIKKEMFKQ